MFNSLQDKLDKALHNISGRGKITEINVAETVKEIRRALVDADVNYKVAKDLTKRVQDKALGLCGQSNLLRATKTLSNKAAEL
jgi:signal recognition particle subunit SRP54